MNTETVLESLTQSIKDEMIKNFPFFVKPLPGDSIFYHESFEQIIRDNFKVYNNEGAFVYLPQGMDIIFSEPGRVAYIVQPLSIDQVLVHLCKPIDPSEAIHHCIYQDHETEGQIVLIDGIVYHLSKRDEEAEKLLKDIKERLTKYLVEEPPMVVQEKYGDILDLQPMNKMLVTAIENTAIISLEKMESIASALGYDIVEIVSTKILRDLDNGALPDDEVEQALLDEFDYFTEVIKDTVSDLSVQSVIELMDDFENLSMEQKKLLMILSAQNV